MRVCQLNKINVPQKSWTNVHFGGIEEVLIKNYRWRVDVEVKAVFVHERRVPGRAHEPDRLRTDRGPIDGVVTLPASVRPRRLKN